jgi:Polyketide cyclase / dehydrase and lipid transport
MSMFPQFTVVTARQQLDVSAERAWSRIGAFADAGQFLGVPSGVLGESRGLGTVRRIGEAAVEVMVGETPLSYTYVQIEGPMAARFYDGHIGVDSTGPDRCELTWALTFDQTLVSDEQRAEEHARLTRRFEGGSLAMKAHTEAP